MGLKPEFKILANDDDVTAAIAARFVGLRITDEAGVTADTLEITLADDPARPIEIPSTGAELTAYLGYDGTTTKMGLFVCDEVELEGWPSQMTIRGRAAPYESTPKGKTDLQTQKTRSWPNKTRLGDMAEKIAKEHGMTAKVGGALASVVLPHYDQTAESDLNFLGRICRRYDAIVKPSGGVLVVQRRGEAGLPAVQLQAGDCAGYRLTMSRRDAPGTVVAWWHSKASAKRKQVSAGKGEPTKQIRHSFPTEEAALAAVNAELERRKRGQLQLTVTMRGDVGLVAEAELVASGFRPGVDGTWLIRKVTHTLDKHGGYVCQVDAEKPDDE